MRGTLSAGYNYLSRDAKALGENIFIVTTLVMAVILWQVMVRLGLFSPLIPPKEK